MKLYFTRDATPYNVGETATFSDEEAAVLLVRKVAVEVGAPAPAVVPEPTAPVEFVPDEVEETHHDGG